MTVTANKNLSEPANGSTSWDVPLNANFTNIDSAFGGTQAFNLAGASGTVSVSGSSFIGSYPANTASYIPLIWSLSGLLTANVNLQVPSTVSGEWVVLNKCTGAFTVTISTAAGGTTLVVPQTVATIVAINSSGAFSANGTVTTTVSNPTVQVFLSGSGTYTKPANVTWIRVRAVGGGAGGYGGGAPTPSAPGAGGNTTFGSSVVTANGGAIGSPTFLTGGAGGTIGIGGGAVGIGFVGGSGGVAVSVNTDTANSNGIGGGIGGSSAFGGAGTGGGWNGSALVAGTAGATNSGSGGGGGGIDSNNSQLFSGPGGGSGGFVDVIITSPSSTYAYAVGAGGTAGAASGAHGSAGGAGGSGLIAVEEHYGS